MGYETLGKFHTYETGYETGVWNKGMKHRYETRMKHAHEISGRSKDVKQLHCGDNTFNFKAWYALILAEKKKRWQPLQQKYPQKKLLLGAAQIEWYETCMKQVWNLVWNCRNIFFWFFFEQSVSSIHIIVSSPGTTSAFACRVIILYTVLSRHQNLDLRYTTIRRAQVLSENPCNWRSSPNNCSLELKVTWGMKHGYETCSQKEGMKHGYETGVWNTKVFHSMKQVWNLPKFHTP